MKKLLLLTFLFLALGCSSNEMEESEKLQESVADPLIGVWLWLLDDPYSGNEFSDIESVSYTHLTLPTSDLV